jgi:hypothetical protein
MVRVRRVKDIVLSESTLSERVDRKKTVPIVHRSGSTEQFPREIVNIAKKIHQAGQDPMKMNKNQILAFATNELGLGNTVISKAIENNEPEAEATASEPQEESPQSNGEHKVLTMESPEINPAIAILTQALGAQQIARFDKRAGFEKRIKLIDQLVKEYSNLIN